MTISRTESLREIPRIDSYTLRNRPPVRANRAGDNRAFECSDSRREGLSAAGRFRHVEPEDMAFGGVAQLAHIAGPFGGGQGCQEWRVDLGFRAGMGGPPPRGQLDEKYRNIFPPKVERREPQFRYCER